MKVDVKIPEIHTDISNLEKMFPTGWKEKVNKTAEDLLKRKGADRAIIHYQIYDKRFMGYTIHFWKGEDYLGPPEIIKEH